MSGKPNAEGVRSLQMTCEDFIRTRRDIAELRQAIAGDQKRLETRETELHGLRALIEGKLAEMDVITPGNAGWEQRYFELLLLMSEAAR